ncbi:MAG: cytochrome [Subtercola sp.]|nr:cytochrome [Subtercola sp.]
MTIRPPVADWVTIPDLYRDPFPIYDRLRAEGGVHWVPSVGRYLITSYALVHETELDQQTYSANEEGSLQIRAMGHSMLRRDDPEHYIERKSWQPVLRPGAVKKIWTSVFERNADRYLNELIDKGLGADFIWDFSAPFAAENLREILGFHNVDQTDLQRWSQTMIDATGNYADNPEVWAKGQRSFDEVDVALDEMVAWHTAHPDHSLISSLLAVPEDRLPMERIRANIKMTIGGGLNEPRDALGVAMWALLTHPDQLEAVRRDEAGYTLAFDEALRWIAPIGLYSRQVTRETSLGAVTLPAGARLGICVLSANRDENVWPNAAAFDVAREVKPHLAFGKGVHVCLGAWVARAQVATVAMPAVLARLEGLELVPDAPAELGGWVFRGMTKMPVRWGADSRRTAAVAERLERSDTLDREAQTTVSPSFAIVGAGPAGLFTAQALRARFPEASIDVFEALPVPYGLVSFGVAPDHQGTKLIAHQFERLFSRDGVRFHGNVRVGGGDPDDGAGVTLETLRAAFDAVVVATGLHADLPLSIPGADLPGVVGAGRLTRTLNSHPDEVGGPPRLGSDVVVVGNGNVAMDVVRLLARHPDGFEGTDMHPGIHSAVAGAVRTIHIVGRSEPARAKFDPVMVRELAALPGVVHEVHGAALSSLGEGKDARLDAVRALTAAMPTSTSMSTSVADDRARVRVVWWFGHQPVTIRSGAEWQIEAVELRGHDRTVVVVDATSVVTAIGFGAGPTETTFADTLELLEQGRIEPGLYAAGWVRRGPRGTIPDQRTDSRMLARIIEQDLAARGIGSSALSARAERPRFTPPPNAIDFDGWRRIDLLERSAAPAGRLRAKSTSLAAMLDAARSTIDLPDRPSARVEQRRANEPDDVAAGSVRQPVTILFGTESGNSELVADDLRQSLRSGGTGSGSRGGSGTGSGGGSGAGSGSVTGRDVRVADLADVTAADLDASRLYLIVCSTYGDGELPTSARRLNEALRAEHPDLSALRYAMFGLGDRSYTRTYSRGSEILDETLSSLGATRVGEYGRHDAGGPLDVAEAALEWADGVLAHLGDMVGASPSARS